MSQMGDEQTPTFLDLLRAELGNAMKDLELRLVDRFAAKKDVEAELLKRDQRMDGIEKELDGIQAWRNKMAGALVLLSVATPVATAFTVHFWK